MSLDPSHHGTVYSAAAVRAAEPEAWGEGGASYGVLCIRATLNHIILQGLKATNVGSQAWSGMYNVIVVGQL